MRIFAVLLLGLLVVAPDPADARHGRDKRANRNASHDDCDGRGAWSSSYGPYGPVVNRGEHGWQRRQSRPGWGQSVLYASPFMEEEAQRRARSNFGAQPQPSRNEAGMAGWQGVGRGNPGYGEAYENLRPYGSGTGGSPTSYITAPPIPQPNYQRPAPAIYNVQPAPVVTPAAPAYPAPKVLTGPSEMTAPVANMQGVWVYEQAYRRVIFVPGPIQPDMFSGASQPPLEVTTAPSP